MVYKYGCITIDDKLKMHNTIIDTFIDTTISFFWNDDSTVIRYKLQLTILLRFIYDVRTVQYVNVPYTVSTGHTVLCGKYWYRYMYYKKMAAL